jgi:hypothetical protein
MRTGFGFAEPLGWVAVFSLPAILVIAALILFFHEQFAISTVSIATATLLVDFVAIFCVALQVGPGESAPAFA